MTRFCCLVRRVEEVAEGMGDVGIGVAVAVVAARMVVGMAADYVVIVGITEKFGVVQVD